jgi:peptide/nickel transport system substrate-binding protein
MLRRSAIRRGLVGAALLAGALGAQARTRPHYGGTLRIETAGDPWQAPDGIARQLVLDTLTTVGDTGSAQAALAVAWESQNDAQRWQFSMRANVRFQDGSALTADAVAAALTGACGSGAGNPPCPWKMVRAVGDAVVFVSDSPVPDLPELLAESRFAIAKQGAAGAVVGTGPFRVVGFVNGALTFAANDDCWAGRPFVDTIELRPHRTVQDQWLDLSVGRTDIVEVPPETMRAAAQQHLNVLESRPDELLALTMAPAGALARREMREAAALAVDRSALYNVIFQKQGEITASLLPEWISGYSFLFSTDRDLNQARALRAGTTPPMLPLAVEGSGSALQLAAERLALNLRDAGFNVQTVSAGRAGAALVLREVPLEAASPRAVLDEMALKFGQNGTVTGTDASQLWQAEQGMLSQETAVPLLWLPRAWGVSERVRDLRLSAVGEPLWADASLEGGK